MTSPTTGVAREAARLRRTIAQLPEPADPSDVIRLLAELVTHRYEMAETIDVIDVAGRIELIGVHDCAYESLIGLVPAQAGQLPDTDWRQLVDHLLHRLPLTHDRYLVWGADERYRGGALPAGHTGRPVTIDLTVVTA